ncbi:hypothetical protein [Thiothrix fructosivorans]|jgi:hypothetical protein|uniref:Uncharacterized protein n=1 Tax=Thiothrix fructosivorans TaxID=111770 RepID=A0A8B0SJU9_9GAMM|nr:hypothetical protein [Thiothrix fructosivorans]MBO0613278.1 hypothetical protein [Thiothrix fructosivorans]QTX11285.1 hypothetical protein J1836_002700 [Thiothrix fructosivorans]
MKTLDLVITLLDDCIFSERNATEGAHQALDYIPGGALLGAVAARLYSGMPPAQAFDWFHSGKMRFGNAYPLTTNRQRTFPMPACWHQAKGKSPIEGDKIEAGKVWRLDKRENNALPENQQPQQLRSGYLALDGQLAETHKSFRMKTAIDAEKGRAKDSALFGYDALQAGQRFYAQISCDDAMTAADMAKLETVLKQPLLLGRSRSAEYGRATIEILKTSQSLPSDKTASKEITLWLLSDLMTLDEHGQPTLSPAPQHLGLPKGKLIAENSFLRTRRYSTWNAHKQGYEMERQVICKGSVLVFKLNDGETLTDKHIQQIASGLGVERQAGLGQVWLNPPLLTGEKPQFATPAPLISKPTEHKEPAKKPELIAWLEAQQTQKVSKQGFAKEAKQIARGYQTLMKSVRELKGLDTSVHVGPSHSQWGAVLAAAKSRGDLQIFMNATDGSFKPRGEGWKDEFWQGEQLVSFYNWFRNHYQQQSSPQYIQHLVREIMAKLKNDKGGRA